MMHEPKVSILIPTYNRGRLLEQALRSALDQDYPNLECIVSDNASEDHTEDMVRPFLGDPRLKYYRNQSNIGMAANWRKLVYEYASGTYAKLLNDDDILLDRRHISLAVELLESKRLDIVFSGSKIIWEADNDDPDKPKEIIFDMPQATTPEWWLEHFGVMRRGYSLFPNLVGSAVFNLQTARKLDAFATPCFGMDYELALKLILAFNSGYLKGPHWAERYHVSSVATSTLQQALEGLQLFNRVSDYGAALGISPSKMMGFKRRGIKVFFIGLVANKWFRECGYAPFSFFKLHRELQALDPYVFWDILGSTAFLSLWLRAKNKTVHAAARNLFRRWNGANMSP